MTVNRKVTGTASTIPEGLAVGVFMALAAMFLGSFVAAMLIHQEIMDWEHMGYAVMGILIVSSWIGAVVSSGKIKRRRFLICMASGTVYFIVQLVMTGLFFGGKYSGVGETGLLIFCGSMLGVFIKQPESRRRNRRKV